MTPKTKVVKLRVSEAVRFNTASDSQFSRVYSANSMTSPGFSTNVQPRGFDEHMSMYDHYTVIGSRIKIRAVCADDTGVPFVLAIVSSGTSTKIAPGFSDFDNIGESKNKIWRLFSGSHDEGAKYLTMGFSAKRDLGRPNPLDEDDLRGSISGSPDEGWFFQVYQFPTMSGENPGPVDLLITIDYLAVLTEPAQPTRSTI